MTIAGRTSDVELGDIVKDAITGFEGVAIGITRWLSQCDQVAVKSRSLHEGKTLDAHWFDITHLDVIEKGAFAHVAPRRDEVKAGGPSPAPMPRA